PRPARFGRRTGAPANRRPRASPVVQTALPAPVLTGPDRRGEASGGGTRACAASSVPSAPGGTSPCPAACGARGHPPPAGRGRSAAGDVPVVDQAQADQGQPGLVLVDDRGLAQ